MKQQPSILIPAAAYVRYSSELQDEISIQSQLDEIEAFAAKNGYRIITVYADRAERGSSDTRPQFLELQRAAKEPGCPFKAVIAWKSDRIARRYELAAGFRGFLRRRGIALLFVAEPNIDGPVGALLSAVMDGMNEFYSANLGENVRRGMKTTVSRGYAPGGTAAYGYKKAPILVDGRTKWKWEINPATAPVVRRIYREYGEGRGLVAIANGLNKDEIPAARGGQWKSGQVWATLFTQRDAYLGRLTYNKFSREEPEPGSGIRKGNTRKALKDYSEWIIYEDAHPPLITPEMAAAVDSMRMGREPTSASLYRLKEVRLLTGLLRCGNCGRKYALARGKGPRKYYACVSRRGSPCGARYVRCEQAEDLIARVVSRRIEGIEEEILRAVSQDAPDALPSALEDLLAERADVRRKMGNLVDAISEGIIPREIAAERMKVFQGALERLEHEETRLRAVEARDRPEDIIAELSELPEGWQKDAEFLRAALLALVAKVEVTTGGGFVVHYKAPITPDYLDTK